MVDCLLAHNPPLMTCVPGESYLPILDALYDVRAETSAGTPRLIATRHEAAAANMAEAAGKLTGRAAVCFVTRGPGATHASIGLHTAYQDGTPLLLVVGQVRRAYIGRQAFQEMDYSGVFGSSSKSVVTIMDSRRIPEHVARAMYVAHSGRPGPVVLVVPEDVLSEETGVGVVVAPSTRAPRISDDDASQLGAALRAAHRPILVVGGPQWSSQLSEQIAKFAEKYHIPVVTCFRWQDCVPNASPCFAGYLGLGCNPALQNNVALADLVVALGPQLDEPTTDGFKLSDLVSDRLWLVSEDPASLCAGVIPKRAIQSGLDSVGQFLNRLILSKDEERYRWCDQLHEDQVRYQSTRDPHSSVDLAEIVAQVRRAVPDDAIVTTGAGNYTAWVQRYFEFRAFGTQLAPRNGAMGYGLPAGLAAAAIYPDRTVVTFVGDGGLMMSGNELATAKQYGLRVVVIVVNNSQLGTIRMHQERVYPGRSIVTHLRNPDFVAYARAFGVQGFLVTETSEFGEAFKRALKVDESTLIELETDSQQLTPDIRLDTRDGSADPV